MRSPRYPRIFVQQKVDDGAAIVSNGDDTDVGAGAGAAKSFAALAAGAATAVTQPAKRARVHWQATEREGVAAERVIAIVRKIGLPGRGSTGDGTFQSEIFMRGNRFGLEAILDEARRGAKRSWSSRAACQ